MTKEQKNWENKYIQRLKELDQFLTDEDIENIFNNYCFDKYKYDPEIEAEINHARYISDLYRNK